MSKATEIAEALRAFKKKFSPEDTYYHGTSADPKAFKETNLGTFVSPDPKFANRFNKSGGIINDAGETIHVLGTPQTMPLNINKGKNFDYETADLDFLKDTKPSHIKRQEYLSDLKTGNWKVMESPAVQKKLKENKFDSYFVKEGATKNLAVYDPANIRSVNAKFDPTQAKSRNILAGLGGASILGAAANPQQIQAQEPQTLTDTATNYTADALRALGMNPHRAADNADTLNTIAGFNPTMGAIQLGSDVGHYARKAQEYLQNNFIGENPLFADE